jgi:hypothetical protein
MAETARQLYIQEQLPFGLQPAMPDVYTRPIHPQNRKKQSLPKPDMELPLGIDTTYFETWDVPRWDDCRGYETPIDEATRLPIPILPVDPMFPNTNANFIDYHHLFHPESDLIHGDDSDIALRRSFGQDLPRWLHEHYHRFFSGPPMPVARSEKFVTIVLACAGVLPRQAIEFTKSGPVHRTGLTNDQYENVRATTHYEGQAKGEVAKFYRNQIGVFFANYALEQNISEVVSGSVIDEFLNTNRPEKRRALGNLMIREAIVLSIEPVKTVRQEARSQGLEVRNRRSLGSIVCEFFVLKRRMDYLDALRQRLDPAVG